MDKYERYEQLKRRIPSYYTEAEYRAAIRAICEILKI